MRGYEVWVDLTKRLMSGEVIQVGKYAIDEGVHRKTAAERLRKMSTALPLVVVEVEEPRVTRKAGRRSRIAFCLLEVAEKRRLPILEM